MSRQKIAISPISYENAWMQGLILGDEWANCLTHGIGLILSIIGMIFLLLFPFQDGNHLKMLNYAIYGFSLILLYGASTFYHAVKSPKIKQQLRTLDHCAIYLLIAGSYTPFTIYILGGVWGWTLFSLVWGIAFLGIIAKIYFGHRFKLLSTALYLFMGWLIVIAAEPLMQMLHLHGLYLMILGGLCYTGGVIFFIMDKRPFFHAIWHLFVMGGSVSHYFCILMYV